MNPSKTALVLAETAGIMYALCAAVVALWPASALTMLGWIAHLGNVQQLERAMTLNGFVYGLAIIVAYFYVAGWVFAVLTNKAAKRK